MGYFWLALTLGAAPTPEGLEERALQVRRRITSGEGEILQFEAGASESARERARRFRFAFDHAKRRFDLPDERRAFDGERHIHYWDDGSGRSDKLVTIRHGSDPQGLFPLEDPRVLGLAPAPLSVLYSFQLEDVLLRPDRLRSEVSSIELDGRSLVRIVNGLEGDRREQRLWIDLERDASVVRAEMEYPFQGQMIVDSVQSQLEMSGGFWFPKRIEFQRSIDGQRVDRELLLLENVVLGHDVDDLQFSLESMNIPAGTLLSETPRHPQGTRYWDGEKPVSEGALRVAAADRAPRSGLVFVLANAFLVTGLVLAWWARRRSLMTRTSDRFTDGP